MTGINFPSDPFLWTELMSPRKDPWVGSIQFPRAIPVVASHISFDSILVLSQFWSVLHELVSRLNAFHWQIVRTGLELGYLSGPWTPVREGKTKRSP
jgi:hypothetical protein